MSTRRWRPSAPNSPLGTDPQGRVLCRWCGTAITEKRKRTFCSQACVHEWKLRTSGSYLRRCVLKRDKGVCRRCGRDMAAMKRELDALRRQDRAAWKARRVAWGVPRHRKTLWDAAHVVAVAEGGGECSLENLVTLCLWCHRLETRELARWRAEQRRLVRSAKQLRGDA
jgi:5-methylcytosine-specific restriction protein A